MVSPDQANRAPTAASRPDGLTANEQRAGMHCARGFSIRRQQRIRVPHAKPVPSQRAVFQQVREETAKLCSAVV